MTTKQNAADVPSIEELADAYAEARHKNGSHLYNAVADAARKALLDRLPVGLRSSADIEALAHRRAWRYAKSSDPAHSDTYTFNRNTLLRFADSLMAPAGAVVEPRFETLKHKPTLDVDALAQEIRRVDGNNDLGAGALAEKLMLFLERQLGGQQAP